MASGVLPAGTKEAQKAYLQCLCGLRMSLPGVRLERRALAWAHGEEDPPLLPLRTWGADFVNQHLNCSQRKDQRPHRCPGQGRARLGTAGAESMGVGMFILPRAFGYL